MSCAVKMDHTTESRDVTNSLIEQSDIARYGQSIRRSSKITSGEWAEAVVGWVTNSVILKAGSTGTNVKKKRSVERSVSDLNYQSPSQGDDYWSNSSNLSEIKVKCVGDQEKNFPIPPWKSNIEQGTYRYIPDNGSYRTLKFMYDERREWYTIRKKHPEKVSTAWHQNCKRLQREMRRQLKKELGKAEREKGNLSAKSGSTRTSAEPVSGGETSRSNSFIHSKVDSLSERSTPNKDFSANLKQKVESGTDYTNGFIENQKPPVRKETRVKSTHSDGAVCQIRKMKTIHEREVEPPMPHYSIPSNNQMLKSASDLFIENFSSRISALEDEIKKDSKWLRKNENDMAKVQSNRPKYREPTRANTRESGSTNSTPRQQFKTETLGCEIFSVKPMAQKELKPLEKTRGHSKNNQSQGDSRRIIHSKTSLASAHHISHDALINYGSEMENGHSNFHSGAENGKQVMINTLTGTKINTYNSKKSSKGFTTPSTITLCDSSPSPGGSQNTRQIESYQHILIEKKADKKENIQHVPSVHNITALLPEISGKRLEVTSVAHRLL